MKHYIIVKFKSNVKVKNIIEPIKKLLNHATTIEGVNKVEVFESSIDLPNRYHIMIKMILDGKGLENFDNSDIHKKWKLDYGDMIENKTIFDCEE